MSTGKRKGSGRRGVFLRMSPRASSALGSIRKSWSVNQSTAIERAILFASTHPDFSPARAVEGSK